MIQSQVVLIALAINAEGRRQVLGGELSNRESKSSWTTFVKGLRTRGLHGVEFDDNGNGRITCAEARRHGIAPVRRGHPAYRYMNDRDNDGIVCE